MLPPRQCDPHTDLNVILQPICQPCKRRLHMAQFPHRHKEVVRPWSEGILKQIAILTSFSWERRKIWFISHSDVLSSPFPHSPVSSRPEFALELLLCWAPKPSLSQRGDFSPSLSPPSSFSLQAFVATWVTGTYFPLVTMDWVLMKGNPKTCAFPLRQDF